MELCEHPSIYNGVCNDCGMEINATQNSTHIDMSSTFSEYHSYIDSNNTLPFENDLKDLSIPEEVKNMVMTLASSCPKETHRMGVRRQQLFSYIYLAYLKLGYKFDPEKIKTEMKMNQREVNMALRIVSGTSSIDIPLPLNDDSDPISAPVVVIPPTNYLEDICKKNNLEESYEEILAMTKTILSKNKMLYEYNPKHIAISLVKYYMNKNGINISKFAKLNGISDSILKQHLSKIAKTE